LTLSQDADLEEEQLLEGEAALCVGEALRSSGKWTWRNASATGRSDRSERTSSGTTSGIAPAQRSTVRLAISRTVFA
jgi:hypothetical protein